MRTDQLIERYGCECYATKLIRTRLVHAIEGEIRRRVNEANKNGAQYKEVLVQAVEYLHAEREHGRLGGSAEALFLRAKDALKDT